MSAPNAHRTDAGHLSSLRAQLVKRSTDMPTREEAAAQLRALDAVLADRERLDWIIETSATVLPIFTQDPDAGDGWAVSGEDLALGYGRAETLRAAIDKARAEPTAAEVQRA